DSPRPPVPLDRVLAASFFDLKRPQERLVFREGEPAGAGNFYPAPECGPPPPGFSVMRSGGLGSGQCTYSDTLSPVQLTPLTAPESAAMSCRRTSGGGRGQIRDAEEDDGPDDGPTPESFCLSREIWAYVRTGTCSDVTFFALKGCREDPFCEEPDWDYTQTPPTWWPC
ncbi:MAG: hypothetical protein ACK4N5_17535, partial [Myxococcales bacterium]